MKFKRLTAVFLTLCMVFCLLPALTFTADAATVNYRYSGKYVYNWGTREETATFLSPMAEAFYEDNNITYEQLAALSGSATTSSVPSSALYKKLQTLMKSNHTYETSYNATRDLYKYTDCQQNGQWKSGKISSFYSGDPIGPGWDSGKTWNREHTWPNSKGDASGNGENDIMMLRPTAKSENGSRGNKAYGKSSSYYFPNKESGGTHDVRGDVARIMLFVYCRWGNTGKMWGSSGVIESKAVLLEWAEDDPVDTWELGRNDATEAITGTRNVFVDYPELIFVLFGAEIPENMPTPSGNAMSQVCAHEDFSVVDAKTPTCTQTGNTAGYYCNDCDEFFGGYTVLETTGHYWQIATCTTPKTCATCGTTEGSANGHTWQDATCIVPKTCTVCGTTEGNAKGHNWTAATCTAPKTCTTCGATEGNANGHSWKAATCTAPKTCTVCGTTEGDALGHSWQDATCTAPKTCTVCGATDGRANGHSWKNATCTTAKTCTDCGVTEGGALGHSWQAATCTAPKTCTVCGTTEGSSLGHSWQAATCTSPQICSVCMVSSGRPAGHTYDDKVDGTCNGCGIHRETTENRTVMHMFRMYDPNSGEHFYTGSTVERENLVAAGWHYEGVGFTFSQTTGAPVYRLYDPMFGEHMYTMDEEEKEFLVSQGWKLEGIAFNSAYDTEVPQYRLHNPNATRGAYHFTASEEERDNLIAAGWEYEGIGFYSSWK